MKRDKKLRGSVLVFALLVLSIFLSIALSTAGIVIADKNSSRATEKSALAFQIADGAAENVLKRVYKDTDATLSDLAQALYVNADTGTQGRPQCITGGTVRGSLPSANSGTYEVTFFNDSGTPLDCRSTTWRTDLKRIVSSGTFGGATRAIDVSIRPQGCSGITTVDDADGNTYDTVEIGTQCWMKQNMTVGTRIDASIQQTDNGGTNIIEKSCYDNIPGNCTASHPNNPDGGLYEWGEAMKYSTTEGAQGICPNNWHIPTDKDWATLETYLSDPPQPCDGLALGGSCRNAGTKLQPDGSSGFEGNLAGYRMSRLPSFSGRDIMGIWWSSKNNGPGAAYVRYIFPSGGLIGYVMRFAFPTNLALPVRCIKD